MYVGEHRPNYPASLPSRRRLIRHGLGELAFASGQTLPTDPSIPYMLIFKGDNFDGDVQITTNQDIIPSPAFDHQVGSLKVWGDWSVFAREARNSKRADNPDVVTVLQTGDYNAERLKGMRLYKRITEVKPVGPPPGVTPTAQQPAPPPVTPTPPSPPVQQPAVQLPAIYQPTQNLPPVINFTAPPSDGQSIAPAQAAPAGVDWNKWASIAAVVGTGVTLLVMLIGNHSKKGNSNAAPW